MCSVYGRADWYAIVINNLFLFSFETNLYMIRTLKKLILLICVRKRNLVFHFKIAYQFQFHFFFQNRIEFIPLITPIRWWFQTAIMYKSLRSVRIPYHTNHLSIFTWLRTKVNLKKKEIGFLYRSIEMYELGGSILEHFFFNVRRF